MRMRNNVTKNSPAGMHPLPEARPKTFNYEQRRQDTLARMILTEELGHVEFKL